MKIVPSHEKLVDMLGDFQAIEQAGLDDLLRHEFKLIRERYPAADGDPQSYPDRYRRACALAGRVPREMNDDRNSALIAAMEVCVMFPRRAAIMDAIKLLGNHARAMLANRNRQRSVVKA